MFVPFITPSKSSSSTLYKRKGGGGRGGGGGSSSGGSSGGGRSTPISSGSGSRSAGSTSNGLGSKSTIPAGGLFAGRTIGGGTRGQVYGSRGYGSGYPGTTGLGVAGRGFPFVFWPIAFGGAAGLGTASYYRNNEYGRPNNGSRPGGPQVEGAFKSNSTGTIYRLMSDNSTVVSLIEDINANCTSFLTSDSSKTPQDFNEAQPNIRPEQAIQYYRASSVVLSLDGYNNSAVFQEGEAPDSPLPSGIDTNLLECLNYTIGTTVPLVSAGNARFDAVPSVGLLGLFYVIWALSPLVV